jgi:hypothetical protein
LKSLATEGVPSGAQKVFGAPLYLLGKDKRAGSPLYLLGKAPKRVGKALSPLGKAPKQVGKPLYLLGKNERGSRLARTDPRLTNP